MVNTGHGYRYQQIILFLPVEVAQDARALHEVLYSLDISHKTIPSLFSEWLVDLLLHQLREIAKMISTLPCGHPRDSWRTEKADPDEVGENPMMTAWCEQCRVEQAAEQTETPNATPPA